ncbi:MAG: hypothetical protein R2828_04205 [Saprospiraceae bacterium]
MSTHKKLLFLAYYAPPVQVTGNIRRFHLYKAFQKHFADIYILTSTNGRRMRQDPSLVLPEANIFPIQTFDLRRLLLTKNKQNTPTLSQATKDNKSFRRFRRLADSFPFNLLLDDGGLVYIWKGYQKATKIIAQEGITHVFSSFRPYADHLIAHLLKKKFPELIWIADFRDLPIDPIRKNIFWPRLQRRWNRYVLKKADLVTTVSKGLAAHLEPLHPRIYVLPNGIGSATTLSPVKLYQDKFTISYTGSLYPELQSPAPLFEAIRLLLEANIITPQNIRLLYAGKDGPTWNQMIQHHQLQSICENKGLLNYSKAQQIQRQSHLNLLLSWSSSELTGVLMAKHYDYLAAGRPIITIINGPRDPEFEERFEELKAGRVFYIGQEKVEEAIADYLEREMAIWEETGGLASTLVWEKLEGYRWDELVQGLVRQIF